MQNDDIESSNDVATLEECDVVMPPVSAVSLTAMTMIDDVIESGEDCIITEGTKERVDKGMEYDELEKNSNAAQHGVVCEVVCEALHEFVDGAVVRFMAGFVSEVVDSNVDHNFDRDEMDEEKGVAVVEQSWTVVNVAGESCHEETTSTISEINDDEAVTDEVTKAANECLDLQNDNVE